VERLGGVEEEGWRADTVERADEFCAMCADLPTPEKISLCPAATVSSTARKAPTKRSSRAVAVALSAEISVARQVRALARTVAASRLIKN
jgi:hypothetical protein